MGPQRVDEISHHLPAVVDPVEVGVDSTGGIDGGEAAARIHEAMIAECVSEPSHDLAAVVNPICVGTRSPGDINGGETAARIHEAMCCCIASVEERSHNLPPVVNPEGVRAKATSPLGIERGE